MNVFEEILKYWQDKLSVQTVEDEKQYYTGGIIAIDHLRRQYDKLCPKPSEFFADWVAINPNGEVLHSKSKPKLKEAYGEWAYDCYRYELQKQLPLGIDWRLCCWSIEDAKRIHMDE
jgi:hypothetical protein